ncbi:hypothetical protein [Paucisalibacillus globulus]|uniref:hypothetical protein n=1 Tax=Paucisalibacillus globulus TaxID=351095 RepID=UPI00047AF0CA|nr:hypothetical protein [Paucisalibacillus globulus]
MIKVQAVLKLCSDLQIDSDKQPMLPIVENMCPVIQIMLPIVENMGPIIQTMRPIQENIDLVTAQFIQIQ